MFPTVEVRWFHEGDIPGAVLTWFAAGQGAPAQPLSRIDSYLRLADTEALGIKLREGCIEVKQRQRNYGAVRLSERASGWMEGWRKWSFALAGLEREGAGPALTASHWVEVRKRRWLRRYRITDEGGLVAVSLETYPGLGCDWELTAVRAGDGAWWTLALEAFGQGPGRRDALLALAEEVLAVGQAPALQERNSFGYPAWLARLLRVEGAGC